MVKLDHLICEMLHFINSPALWKVGFASRFIVFIYSHLFFSPQITLFQQLSVVQSWGICLILINQKPREFSEIGQDKAYSSRMTCQYM